MLSSVTHVSDAPDERTFAPVPVDVVTPVPPFSTGSTPITPVVRGRPVIPVPAPEYDITVKFPLPSKVALETPPVENPRVLVPDKYNPLLGMVEDVGEKEAPVTDPVTPRLLRPLRDSAVEPRETLVVPIVIELLAK